MSFVIPFVYLFFMSGNLTLLLKKRFEEVLPSAIMLSGLILYLASFLGKLSIGFYLLVFVSLGFPIFLLIKKNKEKELILYLDKILTPGLLIFFVVYLEIYILNLNRGFTEWDEFSHWGPMVKETLRLDTFYSDPLSKSLTHKDYPPAIVLIEVLWCKLNNIIGSGYREDILYKALQTFILSMYMPAFNKLEWKNVTRGKMAAYAVLSSLILLSLQLIMPLGEAKIFATIYTDGAMAVVFAYCLFTIIANSQNYDYGYYFQISISLTFLLLIKQMGIALYLLALGIYLLNIMFINSKTKIIVDFKELVYIIGGFVGFPQFFSILWSLYIKKLGIKGQFSISSIKLKSLFDIVQGCGGEEWQHTVYINFIDKFCTKKLKSSPLPLSYWQLVLILGLMLYLVGKINKDLLIRKQIYLLDICIVLGSVAYAVAMMLLYMYSFGEYEGTRIVCYERYMGTYIFAFFSLIIMMSINKIWIKGDSVIPLKHLMIVLGIIWISLMLTKHLKILMPVLKNNSAAQDLKEDENIIKSYTEEDAKIYLISQWNNGYDMFRLSYLTLPRTYNKSGYSLGYKYYDDDIWTKDIAPAVWYEMLKDYDYLYLKHIDEQFINKYGFAVTNSSILQDRQVYEIIKVKGDIELRLINVGED